jgi:hypothetical protein
MSKLCLLLLLSAPLAIHGQSTIAVPEDQCLYHSGDDTAWAAPSLNESGWHPYSEWRPTPDQPHLWVRCHADLSSLLSLSHPGIQVSLYSAYTLYLNGILLGGAGSLKNGKFSLNTIRSFEFPRDLPSSRPAVPSVIALRITSHPALSSSGPIRGLTSIPLELQAGEISLLDALRARSVLSRSSLYAATAVCYGVIGVVAIMLFSLFLFDRSRLELLLLSMICLSLAALRLNEFATASLLNYSLSACLTIVFAGNVGLTISQPLFMFVLAGRRVPIIVWVLIAAIPLTFAPAAADALLAANQPAWLGPLNVAIVRPASLAAHTIISLAPFLAFLPLSRLPRRIRPLGILCMLWGIADFVWFAIEITGIPVPGIPNLFATWGLALLNVRLFVIAAVVIVLLALLFREQRQAAQERALMAGELQAASQIQHMLAPATVDCAPGLEIHVAFHPVREVGGDFYLCRVLPDGRQRIILGDVSGKGSAAAMTATLILGAAAAREADSPSRLLAHLNRVLLESQIGGFATCLCADVSANVQVTLANAGHLPPYLRGDEVSVPSSLPLGLNPQASQDYTEINIPLTRGDTLTFLSDGIVEARNTTGDLFGFDRTRALSIHPAFQIARTAQSFGQQDDITVLTLTRLQASVQLGAENRADPVGIEALWEVVKSASKDF